MPGGLRPDFIPDAEFERLKALGVNFGQGYLFGRPQPVDQIEFDAPVQSSRLDAA